MANRITSSISMKHSKRNRMFGVRQFVKTMSCCLCLCVIELMFIFCCVKNYSRCRDSRCRSRRWRRCRCFRVYIRKWWSSNFCHTATIRMMCLRYLLVLSSVGGTASHSTDSSSLALKLRSNWNEMLIYWTIIHWVYTVQCTNKHSRFESDGVCVADGDFKNKFRDFFRIDFQFYGLFFGLKMVFHNMWQVLQTLNQLKLHHLHFDTISHFDEKNVLSN